MSQISQDIRYAPPNRENANNPESLYSAVKPSRIIITDGVPEQEDGELLWYAIDQDTGVLYNKTEESGGQWQGIYQFAGGAGGITDGVNVGGGTEVFKDKNGSLLEFKTLVSQPDANESTVIIKDNLTNTEVNLTSPQTVASITNYGNSGLSAGWVIDNDSTTIDANGNFQLYAKPIIGGTNIFVDRVTAGSDEYIRINSTLTPQVRSYAFAYLPDGNNYTASFPTATIDQVVLLQSQAYFVDRQDWEVETILGICYLKYVGTSNKKFRCTFDVGAQILGSLNNQEQQISFVLVQDVVGLPVVTSSSTNMNFLPIVGGSVVQSWAHSTFIFTPTINERYTLGAIPRQVSPSGSSNLNIFKTNISLSEI